MRRAVVAAADATNPRNDTASVLERGDGSLLVVWHKYEATDVGGSDFGRCHIHAKLSHDGGLTWGHERRLVAASPGDLNVQAPALARLPSGDVLLNCLRAHARNSSSMLVFRSRDDGETFGPLSAVWERSQGQWLQGGASSLVVLSSGHLLLPFHGGTGEQGRQHSSAGCFLSPDGGETWRRAAGTVDLPMRGAMEASVAELSSGRLLMTLRTQLGSVFLCHSDDGGETWSLPQTTGLKAPESCTCLRRIPGTDAVILLWNDSLYDPRHHHYGLRTPLSAAVSTDGGGSWRRVGEIDGGHAEMTNLGCTFTRAGNAVVTYTRAEGPPPDADPNARFNRDRMDLMAALIDREWLLSQL